MALECMICGKKERDPDTIRFYRKKYPGLQEDEIPYLCISCAKEEDNVAPNGSGLKTISIFFRDLKPEAQKRLLKGYGVTTPEEARWDEYPVFTLFPEIAALEDFGDWEDGCDGSKEA